MLNDQGPKFAPYKAEESRDNGQYAACRQVLIHEGHFDDLYQFRRDYVLPLLTGVDRRASSGFSPMETNNFKETVTMGLWVLER